jgi:hypothetical protein
LVGSAPYAAFVGYALAYQAARYAKNTEHLATAATFGCGDDAIC